MLHGMYAHQSRTRNARRPEPICAGCHGHGRPLRCGQTLLMLSDVLISFVILAWSEQSSVVTFGSASNWHSAPRAVYNISNGRKCVDT
eukprot:13949192-Alexandrium_andersonii.AAC.1